MNKFGFKRNKSKIKKIPFPSNNINITRAGSSFNPLDCFNIVNPTINGNDVAIDQGDYRYIGGDSFEVNYDFGTKVANSVAECPMKYYMCADNTLHVPTGSWYEYPTQSNIDKLKVQGDGLTEVESTNVNGVIAQAMVELDLTPLLTLFGTNALMKSAVKSIEVNVWAKGEGSNGGVLANGVNVQMWDNTLGVWASTGGWSSNSNSIIKITASPSSASPKINTNNKLNILIASQYASDGTIASKVELDYISIKIVFSRAVDNPQTKQVYLPNMWSWIVKGVAPTDDVTVSKDRYLLMIYKDAVNYLILKRYNNSLLAFGGKVNNSVFTWAISTKTLEKYKATNILIEQNTIGIKLRLLKNNDVVETISTTFADKLTGNVIVCFGASSTNTLQADAFTELFQLMPYYVPTDYEAEAMLKGVPKGNEVVYNTDTWAEWSKSGAICDATGAEITSNGVDWKSITAPTSIKLSTKYGFLCYVVSSSLTQIFRGGGDTALPPFTIGSTVGNQKAVVTSKAVITTNSLIIYPNNTEPANNKIKIRDIRVFELPTGSQIESDFANLTADQLAVKYPIGYAVNPPFGIVNKNLCSLANVVLHANATRDLNAGSITLNATAAFQGSTIKFPVLPNNKYEIQITGNGYLAGNALYNNITLSSGTSNIGTQLTNVPQTITITTPNNCNMFILNFTNGSVGIFTFKDISVKLKM